MKKTVNIKKKCNKGKAKNMLKKVGVGVAGGVAGLVFYKIGYKRGVSNCDETLKYVLDDNPDIIDSFNKAWDSSMNKLKS